MQLLIPGFKILIFVSGVSSRGNSPQFQVSVAFLSVVNDGKGRVLIEVIILHL